MRIKYILFFSFCLLFFAKLNAADSFDYKELNAVKIRNNWGYMDWKGKIVISPLFDDAKDFTEGVGQVR